MSSVQSVERAFAVLRCLASGPAGVSEVAERSGLPKSTVSRLLSTLNELGAVDQQGVGGDYRIGGLVAELASAAQPGRSLVAIARPHLVQLTEVLGEATGLSVLDGHEVHYLDHVESDNPVQVRDWTGERLSAHLVSSGFVLLAGAPPSALDEFLARPLPRATAKTMTDPELIRKRVDEAGGGVPSGSTRSSSRASTPSPRRFETRTTESWPQYMRTARRTASRAPATPNRSPSRWPRPPIGSALGSTDTSRRSHRDASVTGG